MVIYCKNKQHSDFFFPNRIFKKYKTSLQICKETYKSLHFFKKNPSFSSLCVPQFWVCLAHQLFVNGISLLGSCLAKVFPLIFLPCLLLSQAFFQQVIFGCHLTVILLDVLDFIQDNGFDTH